MESINQLSSHWRSSSKPLDPAQGQTSRQTQAAETPPSGETQAAGQNQTVGAASESSGPTGSHDQRQQLTGAVKDINDFLHNLNRTLNFKIDDDTGKVVVLIKDSGTDKVIQQIPSEQALEIAKRLEELKGLLVKEEA